jgi:cation transport regulator ChaB
VAQRKGSPRRSDLPSTLRRSDKHAQATWQQTHDSAAEQYGDGERAHRTAFSALKHSYEKVGDHWEPKAEKGPSDAQAARSGRAARDHPVPTAEGVDANATKQHLMMLARRLDITGRSRMRKAELVEAIMKANRRETARAR